MSRRLTPWTVAEWGAFARRCRDVRDRIDRAIREMPETPGVTTRHGNLLIDAHNRMWGVLLAVESEFARQHPDREHEAIRLAHGDNPNCWGRCSGRVKRNAPILSRAGWVEWGNRLKAIERDATPLLMEFQGAAPKARLKRFLALSRALSRARHSFDPVVCRQHPDWPDATRVFYGEPQTTTTEAS